MKPDDLDIDEVAFQTLWADSEIGLTTAYFASVNVPKQPSERFNRRSSFDLGLVVGLVLFVVWMLW